ncbi:unnamed protein product, partial [Heterosigma akashiwo]
PEPAFCKAHRTDEMINLFQPKCEEPTCGLVPSFAFPDERKARFCVSHKLEGMCALGRKRRPCLAEGCEEEANFCHGKGKVTHCELHQEPGMRERKKYQ